jgi:hypothetical protein
MIVGVGGEVPGFVDTKSEILQLVRYWAKKIIDLDFVFFLYGSTGSFEWRTNEFANRRLNTISKLIGEEEVNKSFRRQRGYCPKRSVRRTGGYLRIFTEGAKEGNPTVATPAAVNPLFTNDRRLIAVFMLLHISSIQPSLQAKSLNLRNEVKVGGMIKRLSCLYLLPSLRRLHLNSSHREDDGVENNRYIQKEVAMLNVVEVVFNILVD